MERKLRNSHGSWAPVCLWPQTDVLNPLGMESMELNESPRDRMPMCTALPFHRPLHFFRKRNKL